MEPIGGLTSRPSPIGSVGASSPVGASSDGGSFNNVFTELVEHTNTQLVEADHTVKDFVRGAVDNPQDVMIRLEEANLSLQFTLQVRNKVVEAYQEVMRMQL